VVKRVRKPSRNESKTNIRGERRIISANEKKAHNVDLLRKLGKREAALPMYLNRYD